MSFFFSRRKIEVPASVPPVPTEQMKPSTLPCVSLPDFRAGREIVRLAVVEVVPLVGEQHAVLLGLAQLVGEAARDVLVVVRDCCRAAAGTSISSAPQSRSMSFFSWLCVSGMTISVR